MDMATVFAIVAVVASIMLLQLSNRVPPTIALLAAAVEVALAFGVISISVRGISLTLVLGAALVGAGMFAWADARTKPLIAASTVVIFIGAIQVLQTLRIMG